MAHFNLFNENSVLGKSIQAARQKITKITADSLKREVVFAGMMALGAAFMVTSNTASAASGVLKTTKYETQLNTNKAKVTLKLNKAGKVKVTKASGIGTVKKVNQDGKKVTVTIKAKNTGQCNLKVTQGSKSSTAKVTIKLAMQGGQTSTNGNESKANADHNISKTVSVGRYHFTLGASEADLNNQLNSEYGNPVFVGQGCHDYETTCYYYQKNGEETSFMLEFYNGKLDRVLFSSPEWKNGTLNQNTALKSLDYSSTSYTTADKSESSSAVIYEETKDDVKFTMHYDNTKEWKDAGWYLCELESTQKHTGSNSLQGQTRTISFDLSKYNTGGTTAISKNKVVNACKKMDALALEKGRQNVYLSNMYRAYHGLELSNYSEIASEYAYISSYVRSQLSYKGHLEYFTGDFEIAAVNRTIRTTAINEWWSGWQETFSENAGYQSGADAVSVLVGTVASSAHLENILRGNFAMGAAIINGYDTVETMMAGKMDEEEIKEAQEGILDDYDLGIDSDQVSAAMYWDNGASFSYDYLYQMTTMSKSEWIDFVAEKIGIKGADGAEEYLGSRYDEYYNANCDYIYYGKDGYYDLRKDWVRRDVLTQSELEAVYLYFCKVEYEPAFTQALMQHFGCSENEVYLEHSDIVVELGEATGSLAEQAAVVQSIATKYGVPLRVAVKMYTKTCTSYPQEDKLKLEQLLYDYFGI